MTNPGPGDPSRVADFLRLDRLAPALADTTGNRGWLSVQAELISGGKSNLTFLLRCEGQELVLRRPPTGKLLPSAHDMAREARVQDALAETAVPTARVVLSDGGDLIGAPCYVMEKVPGHVVRGEMPVGFAEGPMQRRQIGIAIADTLAALHLVEPGPVGLANFGRPDGFLARQVRTWTRQWESSRSRDVPEIDELARRLAASIPVQDRTAIVHGDYRLDNVVLHLSDPGRINAVLDWELSTLGDPMTDLAYLLLFWRQQGDPELTLIPGVSHLPGFPTRDEMLERYTWATGFDTSDFDWYLAFAHFKFAAISEGVATRSRSGAMAGQDFGNPDLEVLGLGQRGLALV